MIKRFALCVLSFVITWVFINVMFSGGVLPFPGLCHVTLAEVSDARRGTNFITEDNWYCTVTFEDKGKLCTARLKYSSIDVEDYDSDVIGYVPVDRVLIRYRKKLFGGYKVVRHNNIGTLRTVGYLFGFVAALAVYFFSGKKVL